MERLIPGYPITKIFSHVDDAATEYIDITPKMEANQVFHVKAVTLTYNTYHTSSQIAYLEIDAGEGFVTIDLLTPTYWNGDDHGYDTAKTKFDFYITEGQHARIRLSTSSEGDYFHIGVFGEMCYRSNFVEVGD